MAAPLRMGRIRIECCTVHDVTGGVHFSAYATAQDARVIATLPDGEEIELQGIESIQWSAKPDNEPATATVRLFPDSVSVEALAKFEIKDEQ